jgi:5-methylcytosine-specific restriction endonuclease McrA
MQLSHLTDSALDLELARLTQAERVTLIEILHHLKEADRRRLYSAFGYSSLFDYAVCRFSYSEDQAWRRINAMRLLKDLPQIEEKIVSGALSLSNLAQAQTLFRQEKKADLARSQDGKLSLLAKIEHCSKRRAEKVFEAESLVSPKLYPEVESIERRLIVSPELEKKLKRLEEIKSHPEFHYLLEQMADLALSSWDPIEKAKRHEKRAEKKEKPQPSETKTAPAQKHRVIGPVPKSRYIDAGTKHAVYLRDNGQCVNCGTSNNIEIDHIESYALGGENKMENLRLLCRSCNQRHAIETYGAHKMSSFLRSTARAYCLI